MLFKIKTQEKSPPSAVQLFMTFFPLTFMDDISGNTNFKYKVMTFLQYWILWLFPSGLVWSSKLVLLSKYFFDCDFNGCYSLDRRNIQMYTQRHTNNYLICEQLYILNISNMFTHIRLFLPANLIIRYLLTIL